MTLIESFKFAIEGIINTTKNERNLKIHFLAMICVFILGFLTNLNSIEWSICIILISIIISGELFNTAIEKALDYAGEYHPLIKFAKDASAGAVLVLAIVSVVIGLIIFLPKLL